MRLLIMNNKKNLTDIAIEKGDIGYLFNVACSDGNIDYVKEKIKELLPSELEFGLSLAAHDNNVDIVAYILDSNLLNKEAKNSMTNIDNAFMSSLTLKGKPNEVTKYLLEEKGYVPKEDILFWIEENEIDFNTEKYW